MRKSLKSLGSLLLVCSMLGLSVTGCSQKAADNKSMDGSNESVNESSKESVAENADFAYPMKTDKTVTYWTPLNANVSANYGNLGETDFYKGLHEQSGISVEFRHPAVGQEKEQFNLLLLDEELPDVIEWEWFGYDGGPQKAIDDGVIIPLNDVFDKYCPNIKAYLKEHPDVDKMIRTDNGDYYCFPFIRGGDLLLTSMGPMLRADWLEELGLEVPKTIDEWETVLTAFKEKKGATGAFAYWYSVPDLTNHNPFACAYNARRTFYMKDGKIAYGAIEDGYKNYLQKMSEWMKAGLIDPDLATLTNDQVAAKITNGSAGASFAWGGSGMGNWTKAGQETNSNFRLVAAPYPTLEAGQKPEMGQKDNFYPGGLGCAAITTSCKDVEVAARLLDFGYSDAGHILYNFGTEGVSYKLEDGKHVYTDTLLKNPNLSITHAMAGYVRANYNGPFIQDEEYILQYFALDEQKEALKLWSDTNTAKYTVPPITPNAEESKEIARIMTEINTYRDECTLKFILGTMDMSEWDTYVSTIKSMGIDKVLEMENAALERYNAR